MRKSLAIAALFALVSINSFAQTFSLKAGYNHFDAIMSPEPLNVIKGKSSFHAGIAINDIKLSEKIGIQPELLYSHQGFKVGGVGNVGLHYLSAPVLARLALNDRLAVLVGPQVSYLANARIGVVNDLFSVSYDGAFNKVDVSAVGGLEIKVSDDISLGGRYNLGLNNINKDFNIGNTNVSDFVSLRNSGFQAYLSYRFK